MSKLKGVIDPQAKLEGILDVKNEIKVEIIGSGPSGPVGPTGEIGPTGESGISAYEVWLEEGNSGSAEDFLYSLRGEDGHSKTYVHEETISSDRWIINHNLNKFPSVSIVDTGQNLVVGAVEYISNQQIIVTFKAIFSGKAFLN